MAEIAHPPGMKNSRALDINDRGVVVGTAGNDGNPFQADLAWVSWEGDLHDLNDLIPPSSGWDLRYALRINNRGQILVSETHPPTDGRCAVHTPR